MKVGLYFGTFNPVHNGHLAIANHMITEVDLEEVWLVVTPQNPLKDQEQLLAEDQRLELATLATEELQDIKVSNVEFLLCRPNYTVQTLHNLSQQHTDHTFVLIMGEDNLRSIHHWKDHKAILDQYAIYVYPRATTENETADKHDSALGQHINVQLTEAPLLPIGATEIRKMIKENQDASAFMPEVVWDYIKKNRCYS